MEDGSAALNRLGDGQLVTDVAFDKCCPSRHNLAPSPAEVVQHHNLVAATGKRVHKVAADEARAARHKDFHHPLPRLAGRPKASGPQPSPRHGDGLVASRSIPLLSH